MKYFHLSGMDFIALGNDGKPIDGLIKSIDITEAPIKWTAIRPDNTRVTFKHLICPFNEDQIKEHNNKAT